MKIKEKIVEICGEKIGEIFSESQGTANLRDLRLKVTLKEVIIIYSKINSKDYNDLKQFFEESKLFLSLKFLESVKNFVTTTYDSNVQNTKREMVYNTPEYIFFVKAQATEIFESDQESFVQETIKQLQKNPESQVFFKKNILKDKDTTTFNNFELKSNIELMSKLVILNCIIYQYELLKDEPLYKFEAFFYEDTRLLAISVLSAIKSNGLSF